MSVGTTELPRELPRELDSREHDGVCVTLLWNPNPNAIHTVFVSVVNERDDESFIVPVCEGQDMKDVFLHPYAYRG